MQKRCSSCKLLLNEEEFTWKYKNVKRSLYCRTCSRSYVREHYKKNRAYYLNKAHQQNKIKRDKIQLLIGKYLSSHPCVDCGETDILVLEFDHRERSSKIGAISDLVRKGLPFSAIRQEMSKCEVRCANCHRRKTAVENKSWKLNFSRP